MSHAPALLVGAPYTAQPLLPPLQPSHYRLEPLSTKIKRWQGLTKLTRGLGAGPRPDVEMWHKKARAAHGIRQPTSVGKAACAAGSAEWMNETARDGEICIKRDINGRASPTRPDLTNLGGSSAVRPPQLQLARQTLNCCGHPRTTAQAVRRCATLQGA